MAVLVTAHVENQTEALYDSMLTVLEASIKQAPGFIMHRLTARGATLSKQPVLRDLCTVAGGWISEGERIIVAGNPCAHEGELWISEVFDEGKEKTAKIALPAGAMALSVERIESGELVAVGMFNEESPNELHGWFLNVTPSR